MAILEFDTANDDGMRQPGEPIIRVTGDEVLATRKYPGTELVRWQDDGGRFSAVVAKRSGLLAGKAAREFSLNGAVSHANMEDAERAARIVDTRQVVFQGGNFSPTRR